MTNQVLVRNGVYANKPVVNQVFNLVRPASRGRKGLFVTVDGSELTKQPGRNIRILLDNPKDIEYHGIQDTKFTPEPVAALVVDTGPQFDNHVKLHNTFLCLLLKNYH